MPTQIGLNKLQELLSAHAQLVEVLPAEDFAKTHLPGAVNLPLRCLDERSVAAALDSSRPVVVYCWDPLWDLSPRAACRLEALGFSEVYDYVPGKVDWLAHGLPVEGERADPPTAGSVARDDVVRCAPDERVAAVREAVASSAYPFALVTGLDGMLLGRVRASALEGAADGPVGELMELGPSTVRPHRAAGDLARALADRELRWAIVTTPEGRLVGVASRRDLEHAAGGEI